LTEQLAASVSDAQTTAAAFVAARREARVLTMYPGTKPAGLTDAYAVQDRAIALDGRAIAGWKVGRINSPDDARLGTNRLAGPVFEGTITNGFAENPEMPVFDGGFSAAEAEFMLHVASGFGGAVSDDDAGTLALIDDVRIGIEIASSPYPGINTDGPLVTISDFGNNAGLVLGPQLENWRGIDLLSVPVSTVIDGQQVGAATAATMLNGPLGAVRFLLTNLIARGIDTSRGLWVSTGAVTGVHQVKVGQSVTARFGNFGEVHCTTIAARAG
jgi:2-keto-4-pentenoate hydratase